MKNAFVLAHKDMSSYFKSWTGAIIMAFFLLVAGIFFSVLVLSYAKISLNAARNAYEGVQGLGLTRFVFSSFFLNMGAVLIFLVPFLSMRAFAEERKQETLELLYTYPLSDFEIVWGKFLGLIWFFMLLLAPTLVYVFITHWLGGNLDWGPVLTGYLGYWMIACSYFSMGLFVSSITSSPVLSAIMTFVMLLIFWILDWITGITDGAAARFLSALSPLDHYQEFALGILDLSNFIYFLFFTLYFLFLTLRSIETRNWKG
jgi:ABC-2 type transport system permease protein